MEVKPSYKQTEAGVVPADWGVHRVGELVRSGPKNGYSGPSNTEASGTPTLSLSATTSGRLILNQDTVKYLETRVPPESDLFLKANDVLVQRSNTIDLVGTTAIFTGPANTYIYPDLMMRLRFRDFLLAQWFWRYANSSAGRRYFMSAAAGSTGSMPKLSGDKLRNMVIPLPPTRVEQEAIAVALSDADVVIESLEQLVDKKRQIKHGAMQELLTGRKRLPGFTGEWETKQIAEIATPCTERNVDGESLPVLTCSKHLGFVDSLGYFKNQVFSRDTSGYKVIRRGEIGYPANHIEEGSIGLQDRYDAAIVSPIYVVFAVSAGIDSYFLHRLLKLDAYRQQFQTATSSSVDRRGSLRWPAFSHISVALPLPPEQQAIAAVLSNMDAEIVAIEAKLAKARQVKQGMMQELLTGRIRLI